MSDVELSKLEEFDKLKTKVLKYVLYKKRTEQEVRQKFSENAGILLDNVVEYLKEQKYINDDAYIERAIKEMMNLKNLSIREVKYKLLSKGIEADLIDNYIYNNKESMLDYEINSAKKILQKKSQNTEQQNIINYLRKKGYMDETIKTIGDENE